MATIDPDATTTVSPEEAALAAGRARRTRPAVPNATAQATAAQIAQSVAPPGSLTAAVAGQQPALDEKALTNVLRNLGYGTDAPDLVAPLDGEGTTIEFVASGLVRIPGPVPPQPDTPLYWRLRPPLLGEHRKLRGALHYALEAIDEATIAYQREAGEIAEQRKAADAMDRGPDRSEAMLAVKRRQRAADEDLEDTKTDTMASWWKLAFETVGDPAGVVPAEFGAWVTDTGLAAKIINHWRTSPLAPGR